MAAICHAQSPLYPGISDGYGYGATVNTGTWITVSYTASAPNGNLSGIRINIWNSTTGYFDNGGGGFTPESGTYGEVDRSVYLSAPGNWYFWTDAQCSDGTYASTGAWGAGYYLNVPAPPPQGSFDGISPTRANTDQTAFGSGWATNPATGQSIYNNGGSVGIYANGSFIGNASLGGWRPDVGNAFGNSAYNNSGWTSPNLVAAGLAHGTTYSIVAIITNASGQQIGVGPLSFTPNPDQPGVSLSNQTIYSGQAFTPSYSGGAGSGNWQFAISGYTNWSVTTNNVGGTNIPGVGWSGSWTPPGPGSYTFYVAKCGDANWQNSSAAGPYTLTVVKANQSAVGSSNATIAMGQSFTPSFSGGSGSGGWQWVVSGYTNFDGGTSGNTGTNVPGIGWANTWTPPAAGTYSFYVVKDGDAYYNPSGTAGPYTLTVNPVGASFSGSPTSFTYNGGSQGPSISANPSNASYSVTSGTASATNVGGYSFTVTANGNYSGSSTINWSIGQAGQATVSISPTSPSVTAGGSVTFTASGGSSTGAYTWGGSGAGTGTSQTVTFPNVGTYNVTVYKAGDGNYTTSNTATATITVNSIGTSFSGSPTSFTYNGSAQGPGIVPSPAGATYSVTSGTSSAAAPGNYSFVVTANGNYAGANTINWSISAAGQGTVSISPTSPSVTAGNSITFTASGGSGTGAYTWGGSGGASGSGSSKTVTFPNVGTYTVTVYRAADTDYSASNTATATITVNAIATTFAASPLSFTYNGSAQGPTITPTPPSATYSVTSGTSSATAAGAYSFTVTANGNYSGTGTFSWSISAAGQGTVSISPTSPAVTAGGSVALRPPEAPAPEPIRGEEAAPAPAQPIPSPSRTRARTPSRSTRPLTQIIQLRTRRRQRSLSTPSPRPSLLCRPRSRTMEARRARR